jgi:hypothetical protein
MRQTVAENEIGTKGTPSAGEVAELKVALRQLQARVDRQSVVILALKDMLLAANKSTEAEFLDRVSHVATEKADSKNCRKCGKAMNPKHARCMYCGEARPAELL